MTLIELDDIETRVLDIVEMKFKITEEQYLDSFEVSGRIDFDLLISSQLYNQVLDYRTITKRIVPNKAPALSGEKIHLGFIGISQASRRRVLEDSEYLGKETPKSEFTKIDGLPDNRIISFETKLTNAELEDLAKSSDKRRLSYNYQIKAIPVNLIPLRLTGQFVRDYEVYRKNRGQPIDEELLGKSSLSLTVTNNTSEASIFVSELRVQFKEALPRLLWSPKQHGRLYPERHELVFSELEIKPKSSESFDIITNLDSIMNLGIIQGQLRVEIDKYTISGLDIEKIFSSDGLPIFADNWKTKHLTRVVADIELDPRVMEETLLHSQSLTFHIDDLPEKVFDDVVRYFNSSGYLVPTQREEGERNIPHEIKSNTWVMKARLDGIRRIFEDSVVRINANIDGEYGEITEEKELQAGGMITSKGKKRMYGRTTVTILAQSTNQNRLNQCIEETSAHFK
ncbi:hypothetical protein ACFLV0_05000 [Chloroflexota bacterium]